MIELAPSLVAMVFGALPTVELVEAAPIAAEVALAAPVEIVAVTAPTAVGSIVAAASTGSVEVSVVVEQQLALLAPCDHCEGAARYTTRQVSPMQ